MFNDAQKPFMNNLGLLILRLGIGGMMLFKHGLPKLMNYGASAGGFPDPLGIGSELSLILTIFGEFICALLVMLGFATRLAAMPLLVTMLVAAFIFHADDPFAKKELALLYAVPVATLMLTGGGKYSLSRFFSKFSRWD